MPPLISLFEIVSQTLPQHYNFLMTRRRTDDTLRRMQNEPEHEASQSSNLAGMFWFDSLEL